MDVPWVNDAHQDASVVTILLLKLIYGMQQMISHVFLQETEEPDAIVSKQGGKMFLLFVGWKKITTSVGIHNTGSFELYRNILHIRFSASTKSGSSFDNSSLPFLPRYFQYTCTEIFYSHSITVLKNIMSTSCQVNKIGEGSADLKF